MVTTKRGTFDRRNFLRRTAVGAATFALPLLKLDDTPQAAQVPTNLSRIPIKFDYSINLADQKIYEFMDSSATDWNAPNPTKDGYGMSTAKKKPVGKPISETREKSPKPIRLAWCVRKWYEILEDAPPGKLAGKIDVIVPKEQNVKVQVWSVLLLRKDLIDDTSKAALRKKVEDAFAQYEYPAEPDAIDYVRRKLSAEPDIGTEMFSVENTYSLSKVSGTYKDYPQQDDALQKLYMGQLQGAIWTGPGLKEDLFAPEKNYFARRKFRRVLLYSTIEGVPDTAPKSLHQPEPSNKNTDQIIDDILNQEKKMISCSDKSLKKDKWPIMTVLVWPEFMVKWQDVDYDLGCGVHVVLRWPRLLTRNSELNLWAYAQHSPNNLVDDVLYNCIYPSALAGTVIGIVTTNIELALSIFIALLENCVKVQILCLIPGLALITKSGDWH
jgi:hypothetical protein